MANIKYIRYFTYYFNLEWFYFSGLENNDKISNNIA